MGASLHRLHIPIAFGERAGFDVVTSHIFPQGVMAAFTLVESVAVMGQLEPSQGEVGLPLCSVSVTTMSVARSTTKLLEHKL